MNIKQTDTKMIGKVFTRLRVVNGPFRDKRRNIVWDCLCDCGNARTYAGSVLRAKRVKSCGCLRDENSRKRVGTKNPRFRHGMASTKEWRAYQAAKGRCQNPNTINFRDYGGRGIQFRFSSFEDFFSCVGFCPSADHSLDRYPNNDGHYEKGNVRWATDIQQINNRRIKKIEDFSDDAILAECSRRGFDVRKIST